MCLVSPGVYVCVCVCVCVRAFVCDCSCRLRLLGERSEGSEFYRTAVLLDAADSLFIHTYHHLHSLVNGREGVLTWLKY